MTEGNGMRVALSNVLNYMKQESLVPDIAIKLKVINGNVTKDMFQAYLKQVAHLNSDTIKLNTFIAEANRLPKHPIYLLLRNEAIQLKCRNKGLLIEVPCFGVPQHCWGHILHALVIKNK